MRYRQILNKETNKYELIPVKQTTTVRSAAIHGDIDPFVSIVDGSVVSSRSELREHNKRNRVVQTADLRGTKPTRKSGWSFESKQDIYNRISRLEGQS